VLRTAQDIFALDNAFFLIEGHPAIEAKKCVYFEMTKGQGLLTGGSATKWKNRTVERELQPSNFEWVAQVSLLSEGLAAASEGRKERVLALYPRHQCRVPTSRSFFARCGIPRVWPSSLWIYSSDGIYSSGLFVRFIRQTGLGLWEHSFLR
jgi:hypothetical protein